MKTFLFSSTPLKLSTVVQIVLLFSVLLTNKGLAQKLTQTQEDQANVYFQKSWASYNNRDVETGLLYADSTREIYAMANDPYGEGLYMFLVGAAEKSKGNYHQADSLFKAFLPFLEERKDTSFLASLYFQLGIVTEALGNLDGALDYQYESIKNYHLMKDTLNTNAGLNNIGSIYRKLKQYELSEKHFLESLDINKKIDSYDGQATNLVNLGNLYAEQELYDKAIDNYKKAVYFDSITNFSWGLGYDYENIGVQYAKMKKYKAAKEQLNKALAIRIKLGGKYELAQNYLKLGQLENDLNNPVSALGFLNKAQAYADDTGVAESIRDILESKSKSLELLGNYKEALKTHQLYTIKKDSIINKGTSDRIASLNVTHETEKKQNQIALLSAKNELSESELKSTWLKLYGMSFGLFFFGLLSFFIYKLYAKTQHQNKVISKALSEKEILIREIHHRVKNNLQFISSLLGLQTEHISDKVALGVLQEGQDRVHSMALIHQNLYQEDNLTGVDMKTYFTKLVRGLFDSYNIRKDQVALTLDIADLNLDVDTVIPIGLVVNELVSNSLKYAFPDKRKGLIKVNLYEENDSLILSVKDDGVGLSPQAEENLGSSFGYRLIYAFKNQLEANLDVKGEDGTSITMTIKNYSMALT